MQATYLSSIYYNLYVWTNDSNHSSCWPKNQLLICFYTASCFSTCPSNHPDKSNLIGIKCLSLKRKCQYTPKKENNNRLTSVLLSNTSLWAFNINFQFPMPNLNKRTWRNKEFHTASNLFSYQSKLNRQRVQICVLK